MFSCLKARQKFNLDFRQITQQTNLANSKMQRLLFHFLLFLVLSLFQESLEFQLLNFLLLCLIKEYFVSAIKLVPIPFTLKSPLLVTQPCLCHISIPLNFRFESQMLKSEYPTLKQIRSKEWHFQKSIDQLDYLRSLLRSNLVQLSHLA